MCLNKARRSVQLKGNEWGGQESERRSVLTGASSFRALVDTVKTSAFYSEWDGVILRPSGGLRQRGVCSDLAVLLRICCLGQLEIGRPVSGRGQRETVGGWLGKRWWWPEPGCWQWGWWELVWFWVDFESRARRIPSTLEVGCERKSGQGWFHLDFGPKWLEGWSCLSLEKRKLQVEHFAGGRDLDSS